MPSGHALCLSVPVRRSEGRVPASFPSSLRARLEHPLVRLVVVCLLVALGVLGLERSVGHHTYAELAAAVRAVPRGTLGLAVLLSAAVYAVMVAYDWLALRYAGRALPLGRVAFISFVSYALSGSIGLALLAGSSIRLALYSSAGLEAGEIVRVIAFGAVSLWVGLLVLAGVVLVVAPPPLPGLEQLPPLATVVLGLALLGIVAAYLAWSVLGAGEGRARFGFRAPAPVLAMAQLVASVADWLLCASIIWVVLRAQGHVPFLRVAGTYLVAQAAGLASHVPAGLGVFDALLVYGLRGAAPAPAALAALVVYRLVYQALPLAAAVVAMTGVRVAARRQALGAFARRASRWAGAVAPELYAVLTFAAGLMLLLAGATPVLHGRLERLVTLLPLGVLEASHFAGSIVGATLLVLARGLQRRLDGAWALTLALLATGAIASSLHGEWGAAALLLLLAAALAPSRAQFRRRSSLLDERFSAGWVAAIVLAVLSSAWLARFAYRHVEWSSDLWWQFELAANAPRALRGTVGAVLAVLLFAAWKLVRPSRSTVATPESGTLERAARIVGMSPSAEANLALLGDKAFLFNEAGNAFLMYGVRGRTWVALGDPVGPEHEWPAILWRFVEAADAKGARPVLYRLSSAALPHALDLGLGLFKLGEEAVVPLGAFSLEGPERRSLRYARQRLLREGCTFEMVAPGDAVDALLPELREVSDAWIACKRTREKGFSLGLFDEAYVRRLPVGVVRQHGRILAFAAVWASAEREEMTVDLMRYRPDTPHKLMDFLLVSLILHAQAQGFARFSLGMVPLSGLATHPLAPRWHRLARLVFEHGEALYNFRGLRDYKARFDPQWVPRYIAVPRGIDLPLALTDVTTLIAGGLKGMFAR